MDEKVKKGKPSAKAATKNDPKRNPKAFSYQSVNKVARSVRRTLDVKEKKYRPPEVDRTPLKPSPMLIAVVGPRKVGKSTLIRCLVKNFASQRLTSITGPVTVVSGKKRRLTFVECNNDIHCMIDIAKAADLVLLLIDASFGFEMEIFEFLSICQVHGFPRVMGVLTHLDSFKDNKQLRTTKKRLKHRFWSEVYQGAKLFYLSGTIDGEYQQSEVHNLGRFISVLKVRPVLWRSAHSYLLADRMEDRTDAEVLRRNKKSDRLVSLYGYVRGAHLLHDSPVHLPGVGDFVIKEISALSDPCPLPDEIKKRRSLNEKERFIYSPMSGVGGVLYDKDSTYIDLGGSHSHLRDSSNNELVNKMRDTKMTFAEKMDAGSGVSLLRSSKLLEVNDEMDENSEEELSESELKADIDESDDDVENDSSENESDSAGEENDSSGKESDSAAEETLQYDSGPEDEDPDSSDELLEPKSKAEFSLAKKNENQEEIHLRLVKKIAQAFPQKAPNIKLQDLVYNAGVSASDENSEKSRQLHGEMFWAQGSKLQNEENGRDTNRIQQSKWTAGDLVDLKDAILDCFVTGNWSAAEDAQTLLDNDGLAAVDDADDEMDVADDAESDEGDDGGEGETASKSKAEKSRRTKLAEKKARVKAMFDAEYDAATGAQSSDAKFFESQKEEMSHQSQMNQMAFEALDDVTRAQYEGHPPGRYVRIDLENVNCEFVEHFDPSYPIVVGALSSTEQSTGHVQVKWKKHRWFAKILKTRDPVTFSLGWRRFQAMPFYSIQDHNMRNRALKYTPQHMHCHATFLGPITPQGTGVLAIANRVEKASDFRICATGLVTELDKSSTIVKKLKLTGTPLKIYNKTAFIQGMFTSALEAAKFEGMCIKTVSGIRGQIKKAIHKPEGAYRATFEDKIKLSDIVFSRTWVKVTVPPFYSVVTNLLLAPEERLHWQGMKTTGQLRREQGIRAQPQEDSLFKPITRPERRTQALRIPRDLQSSLPFKDKPKVARKSRDQVQASRPAVVRDARERKVADLMKSLQDMHKQKSLKKKLAMRERVSKSQKEFTRREDKKNLKHKEIKKQIYRTLGKCEKKRSRTN